MTTAPPPELQRQCILLANAFRGFLRAAEAAPQGATDPLDTLALCLRLV